MKCIYLLFTEGGGEIVTIIRAMKLHVILQASMSAHTKQADSCRLLTNTLNPIKLAIISVPYAPAPVITSSGLIYMLVKTRLSFSLWDVASICHANRARRRQLKWYGRLLRMEDSLKLKMIYQCSPHGRRRRGRPQQTRKNQVTDFLRSRNMEVMAEDRHLWRLGMDIWLLAV